MGLNMATHLVEEGYRVVGYNRSDSPKDEAVAAGIEFTQSLPEAIAAVASPKVIWLMVTSAAVDEMIEIITPLLAPGDTIIDGGNSFYQDSLRRHKALAEKELHFLDCGTSGGMEGARYGASIMVGGDAAIFAEHEHFFKALAAPSGYARVGGPGAGHFVKMIHNGIEYGMMGAIAEGMAVINKHKEQFGIDLMEVLKPYEHESIITSKLVTWTRKAYEEGQIDAIEGTVPKGETEFEMEHIVTIGDVKVLEAALAQRKATREQPSYLGKLVAAMRNQFGGHKVVEKQ